jgi:hypothetical protein
MLLSKPFSLKSVSKLKYSVIGILKSFRKRQDKNQQADGADKAVRYGSCLHPQLTVRAFGEAAFV